MPISDLQFNTLAAQVNDIQSIIDQIIAELGDTPQGVYADVRTRLDILEARLAAIVAEIALLQAEFATLQTEITSIQNDIITLQASMSQVLTTLGTNPQGIFPDVASRLDAMQRQISGGGGGGNLPPTTGVQFSALIENPGGTAVFSRLTQDMILPGFTLALFGNVPVEVGSTVVNPSFTATYSATPNSANITNTDSIGSPLTLIFPYTSGTVTGSFTHNTISSVTFTLTATHIATKTATTLLSFFGRTFFGVGGASATSATASGNNAVLVGATGTLSTSILVSGIVGRNFGPITPSGQNIYLLVPHDGLTHTFKDQNGFSFPMTLTHTFSFTNQHGIILSYDMYQSVNSLSTTFTITVVS